MKLLVDADACPVKTIIVELAHTFHLEVYMFFDNSHQYNDGYSTVFIIDKGFDAVDYALISHVTPGDIVVTQDYGVAAMALTKKAYPITQNGLIFTNENIDSFLHSRYAHQKMRKANIRLKGPKKRTKEQDDHFRVNLHTLIKEVIS